VLSYLDRICSIQTRAYLPVVPATATATDVDLPVDGDLDSLFSYGLFYSSSSTPCRLCSFNDAANRSVYSEGSSGSFGLYISLDLD
jgi:hypothetical protein